MYNNDSNTLPSEAPSSEDDDLPWGTTDTMGPVSPRRIDPASIIITKPQEDAQPDEVAADAPVNSPKVVEGPWAKPANFSKTLPPIEIDPSEFPDAPHSSRKAPPATLDNVSYLMGVYGIKARFNRMRKEAEVTLPGVDVSPENRAEVAQTIIESLLVRHGMQAQALGRYINAIADANRYDPFADWVESKPWDGRSRLPDIISTVIPADDYPQAFANVLLHKWLLSIIAATFCPAFHGRGILTFQGEQGIGKTSWFANLVSPAGLRDDAVKLGHSWDGGGKDARISAISHRIVEWGELERSFRKELASLKSFTTDRTDKIRVPYARVASEYPRMTVYGASVNDSSFLIDSTGNSRFWTIAVRELIYNHDIDMQQLFAELKVELDQGAQWWLTPDEEAILAGINGEHEVGNVIADRLAAEIDLDRKDADKLPRLRAMQVLEAIGIDKPSNTQLKEANVALRSLLGPHRRIRGSNYWNVPFRKTEPNARTWQVDSAAEEY